MNDSLIRPSKNLLIYHPGGEINASNILNYIQNVLTNHHYQVGLFEYIYLSRVTKWSISHNDVEEIVQYDGNELQSIKQISKTGIWAPKEIAFEMAQMFQILAENSIIKYVYQRLNLRYWIILI